jgi:phasin family protein
MFTQHEDFQKLAKENMDAAMKSFSALGKGVQALAVEAADYSKKSFESSSAVVEKLMGAKTLDKAIEIQSDYAKTAYEGAVAYATKMGELVTNLAKDAVKPVEQAVTKAQSAAK